MINPIEIHSYVLYTGFFETFTMVDNEEKKCHTGGIFNMITNHVPDRDVAVMSRMIAEKEQRDEAVRNTNKLLNSSVGNVDERKEKIQIRLRNKLKRSKSRESREPKNT